MSRLDDTSETGQLQSTNLDSSIANPTDNVKPKMTRELRREIDNAIYEQNPELMSRALYGGLEARSLNEGGEAGRPPRVHVDDLRHHLGNLAESIPSSYKRRTGAQDLDLIAERAGFDDVEDFLDAWQGQIESRARDKQYVSELKEMRKNPEVIQATQGSIDARKSSALCMIVIYTKICCRAITKAKA